MLVRTAVAIASSDAIVSARSSDDIGSQQTNNNLDDITAPTARIVSMYPASITTPGTYDFEITFKVEDI